MDAHANTYIREVIKTTELSVRQGEWTAEQAKAWRFKAYRIHGLTDAEIQSFERYALGASTVKEAPRFYIIPPPPDRIRPIAPARATSDADTRKAIRMAAQNVREGKWTAEQAEVYRFALYAERGLDDTKIKSFEGYAFGTSKSAPIGSVARALRVVRVFESLSRENRYVPSGRSWEEFSLPKGWSPQPRGSLVKPRLFFCVLVLGYKQKQFMLAQDATTEAYAQVYPGYPIQKKSVAAFWKAAQDNGIMERITPPRTAERWGKAVFRLTPEWIRGLREYVYLFMAAKQDQQLSDYLGLDDYGD